ncbi:hypothetical protein RvY_06312 [Ramazzottius varieornatus]|uniref:Hexosyltransferase n=1 Tax=Ramazzottius varieornatus TaxID=947166 RepID=A0A1D1V6V0_RAMVA|nr:hypothetical protein RvY_06312 [Ramazzottius varieornatus]
MAAISAMIWKLRYLLYCRYSPKKCFALLVLTTLTLSLILAWKQSNVSPEVSFHPAAQSVVPNNAFKTPSILPQVFHFVLQPKNPVCVQSNKNEKAEVDRFVELLEARPDGEDPEVPTAVVPPGLIFLPILCRDSAGRQLIRQTWGSGGWLKDHHIRVIFVCRKKIDTAEQSEDVARRQEVTLYGDILQVDQEETQLMDTSLLMVACLSWIEKSCSTSVPRFVAKASTDIYVNIPGLLAWLDSLPDGVHGSTFKDSKSSASLRQVFYVIKGSQSIEDMLVALSRVQPSSEEADFITGTLAEAALVPRFATLRMTQVGSSEMADSQEADSRSASALALHTGCWIRQQVVFTGLSSADFQVVWSVINQEASSVCSRGDGCCQDGFPIALTVLWTLFLLLMFTIVHSYFWSSLSAFCDDMCNAVDSGAEDEDDSLENSVAATGYESDNEPITTEAYSAYFDVGKPYTTLTQNRF